MSRPEYRIYPSLLDRFQRWLDADADEGLLEDAELGTLAAVRERELLDAVNRVPSGPIEAADRGTCFNEIVDCLIAGRGTGRGDMTIRSGLLLPGGEFRERAVFPETSVNAIRAEYNGFTFDFDLRLCREAAEHFGPHAVPQHPCRACIGTEAGLVELYGYADEIVRDRVYDIKTTSSYKFGKYERGWQKLVYPWCLMEGGEMGRVASFEYTVFVLRKPSRQVPYITGEMYCEEYTYDHAYAGDRLRHILGLFIDWLESNRERITDRKIFGGENEIE